MFVDKNFSRELKHNVNINLHAPEFKGTVEMLIDDFNKLELSLKFDYSTITRDTLIAIIYMLKVGIPHVSNGTCTCKKLSDKYSLQYWLYKEVLSNKVLYKDILGELYDIYVPEPITVSSLSNDFIDSYDDCLIPDTVLDKTKDRESFNLKDGIGILWITRHYMFKCQYDMLRSIYGDNLRVYCYNERVEDVEVIKKICDNYSISVIVAIIPDKLMIEFKEKLPSSIKIIRSRLDNIDDCKFAVINESGDISYVSHSFINGFEEIYGYKFIREPI